MTPLWWHRGSAAGTPGMQPCAHGTSCLCPGTHVLLDLGTPTPWDRLGLGAVGRQDAGIGGFSPTMGCCRVSGARWALEGVAGWPLRTSGSDLVHSSGLSTCRRLGLAAAAAAPCWGGGRWPCRVVGAQTSLPILGPGIPPHL